MQPYHVIEVEHFVGLDLISKVRLRSGRFEQNVRIPYTNAPGAAYPTVETARKYLEKLGHEIVGFSETYEGWCIISNTFEPIIGLQRRLQKL